MDFFKKPVVRNGKLIDKKKIDFDRASLQVEKSNQQQEPMKDISNQMSTTYGELRTTGKSCLADDEEDSSVEESIGSVSCIATTKMDTVKVFLRLKPVYSLPDCYSFESDEVILRLNQNNTTQTEKQFKFTSILSDSLDQAEVYEKCVRQVIYNTFSSSGASFCGYGVSSSGKTYTILGDDSPGIVPRALSQIFTEFESGIVSYPCAKVHTDQIKILNDNEVDEEKFYAQELLIESRKKFNLNEWTSMNREHDFKPKELQTGTQIHIWISFIEIHNEKMIDLFQNSNSTKDTLKRGLRIISNNFNSYVHGLTWLPVANLEDALYLLKYGLRKVKYAATGINAHSSRSHTIFSINIISEIGMDYEFASFKFCDLAGAERIKKTGNTGDRLKEAGGINNSLLVLGRCIETVLHNQKSGVKKERVPFRDSKLTHLLQCSLSGRENFVMIVNLMPNIDFLDENINVLHFGSLASKIVTKKTETKKYSSSRYSYFMKNVINSPKLNSSLLYEEENTDESSIDISFTRPVTIEGLQKEMYLKEAEIYSLYDYLKKREGEFLEKQKQIRQETLAIANTDKEAERAYYQREIERLEFYHNQKMENMQRRMDRKEREFKQEIDCLMRENAILKRKLNINVDEDVQEDDDDIFMVDDDDEENENENENQENSEN